MDGDAGSGQGWLDAVRTALKLLARLPDDLYNAALLTRPESFAVAFGSQSKALTFDTNGADPTQPQIAFKNTTKIPMVVFIRGYTATFTAITILAGSGEDGAQTKFTGSVRAQQGVVVEMAMLVRPGNSLSLSMITSTRAYLTVTPMGLAGRTAVFGDCAN